MSFKQISKKATFTDKIKGSKFIGICFKINSAKESKELISNIEKEYKKASHVCWAFRVYSQNDVLSYSSDAGEPHSSAGPPIQSVLEGRNLVNTLCIVIRYFWGTKLGIGGLIRAYGSVAGKTLDKAGIIEFQTTTKFNLDVPHSRYSEIMRILKKYGVEFKQVFSEESVNFTVTVSGKQKDDFLSDVRAFPDVICEGVNQKPGGLTLSASLREKA